ncbi:MAG: response regulator [Elusimicrobiota bacterium]
MQTATQPSLFIIEDDPLFRETLIDVLALRAVQVRGAGTAREGLITLRDYVPSVIVLDVQLPDIHGFDLCRIIKRMDAFKNTPVIFISGSSRYLDARDRVDGAIAGAALFLTKPITVDKLWSEIELLLAGRA